MSDRNIIQTILKIALHVQNRKGSMWSDWVKENLREILYFKGKWKVKNGLNTNLETYVRRNISQNLLP